MHYEVGHSLLATRGIGERLRRELEGRLTSLAAGETVVIDFTLVEAMTISATDEFLGKLLTAQAAGDVPANPIVLTGLNPDVRLEIDVCLERRKLSVATRSEGNIGLLGGDEYLRATFEAASSRDTFKASDLAAELNVSPQNMNNRLKRLVEGGALTRERSDPADGGRQYVYRLPA